MSKRKYEQKLRCTECGWKGNTEKALKTDGDFFELLCPECDNVLTTCPNNKTCPAFVKSPYSENCLCEQDGFCWQAFGCSNGGHECPNMIVCQQLESAKIATGYPDDAINLNDFKKEKPNWNDCQIEGRLIVLNALDDMNKRADKILKNISKFFKKFAKKA